MRRIASLILLALMLGLLFSPASHASAATYRTWIAQEPQYPSPSDNVTVWMNSDTAFGETAGLEFNFGSTYIKVLGSYDDVTHPGANWRVTIPAQGPNTNVRYQLFTRNQFGSDYGFTGFNWQYTVSDGGIEWTPLKHDTFDPYYRSPFGAVPTNSQVTLRFRAKPLDAGSVTLKVYSLDTNSADQTVTEYAMNWLEDRVEGGVPYAIWTYTLTTPAAPRILYYKFIARDGATTVYYNDDYVDSHDNLRQGGMGTAAASEGFSSFQITVYDPAFTTPDWLKSAVVYQVFPDRFRDGNAGNNTPAGTFFYNEPGGTIVRSNTTKWNAPVCDPRSAGGACLNQYGQNFYGGDLQGLTSKLDYLQALGVDAIYLNPVFESPSNHRYDTSDYLNVDDSLGGNAAFLALESAAQARGMRLILDGVFNHSSSDSAYFDRYGHYAQVGACESDSSAYRSWFRFFAEPGGPCATGQNYDSWFGYDALPTFMHRTNPANPATINQDIRDFFYDLPTGVMPYWYGQGADGWRFDVADDIAGRDPSWWADLRGSMKALQPSGPLIGEVWYDASRYLAGNQLDSVMNYRFRKNVLGFARGPYNWSDNDNNGDNALVGLTPSQFDTALKAVREDYPPQATAAMLNLLDSHDTNRSLYVLTLVGDTGLTQAKERQKLAALFQFTYMGAPMVYYGDEVGMNAPSQANGLNGPEDDPYNRAPYPWTDIPGDLPDAARMPDNSGPNSLLAYYTRLAALRKGHAELVSGDFITLLTDDATPSADDNNTYAFARVGMSTSVVALNNGGVANTAEIAVGAYFADGDNLMDMLGGGVYPVSGGKVTVTLPARTGVLLMRQDATAAALASATATGVNGAVRLAWQTASEVDLAGFNVYRQAAGEAMQKVNDRLIEAKNAGQLQGAAYALADPGALSGGEITYWLEWVSPRGPSTMTPIRVSWQHWLYLPGTRR